MIYSGILNQKITFQSYVANGDLTEYQVKQPANRPCMIQRDATTKTTLDDGVNAYTYTCYLNDGSDITEGDKATDGNGKEYEVMGVEPKEYGYTAHTKIEMSSE